MKRQNRVAIRAGCVVAAWAVLAVPVLANDVTGQWDFNSGDLTATVGANGSYWVRPLIPGRDVEAETQFGTTTSFGIADIGGTPAKVMRFPQTDQDMGYAMYPEIDAAPGETFINRYTLIMDILYTPDTGGTYRALLQTQGCNGDDADFFINGSNGIGISGVYHGNLALGEWHRVVLAMDTSNNAGDDTGGYRKFIDGVFVGGQGGKGLEGRMSLYSKADGRPTLLFSDEDKETTPGYVSSIQIRNYQMSDADVAALGGPTAAGIPADPGVTGQWDFENGDLTSTVGRSLVYFRGCYTGECPQSLASETQFGLGSSFGLPTINEVDPKVMRFPAVTSCTGYLLPHGALSNGESAQLKVNQYSLIMDVYFKDADYTTPGDWISLYAGDPLNQHDGLLFIRTTDGAMGDEGEYGGTNGYLVADQWHRIAIVVDTTTDRFSKYLNGQLLATQSSGPPDDFRALFTKASSAGSDHLLLFTDDDNETKVGYVNSVQFRDYPMTDEEVLALGGPTAAGIGFLDPPVARKLPDSNGDGFVDQHDLDEFIACTTGPAILIAEDKQLACKNFDRDKDNDIDQADFGAFQAFFTGTTPCGANCYYP